MSTDTVMKQVRSERTLPTASRIDRSHLAKKHGPLPTAPDQETMLWYTLYRKNASSGAVEDAHGAYLRYREMTALAVTTLTGPP